MARCRAGAVRLGSGRRRWLMRALALPVVVYVAYLVVMNALLMTGAFTSLLNDAQDDVTVTASRAWTWWFGRVDARDLRILIEEDDVEVLVTFTKGTATVHSLGLFDRECRLSGVRGEQGRIAVRRKIVKDEADERRLAGLAEIEGLPVPLIEQPVPPDDDFSNNWTVHMEDIDAVVERLWIDNFRVDGRLELKGGYRWATGQSLELHDLGVHLVEAKLVIAGRPAVMLDGAVKMDSGALSQAPPAPLDELLAHTRAELRLSFRTLEPGAFDWLVPANTKLTFAGGTLQGRVEGGLDQGTLSHGSYLDLEWRQWAVRYRDFRGVASGSTRFEAEAGSTLGIDLSGTLGPADSAPWLRVDTARVRLRWTSARLMALADVPASRLSLHATAADLRHLPQPEGGPTFEGELQLALNGRIDERGTGESRVAIDGRDIAMHWGAKSFRCAVSARASFAHERAWDAEGKGSVELQRCRMGEDADPWDATFDLWRLAFQLGGERSLSLGMRGRARDADPFFALPPVDQAVPDVPLALIDLENLVVDMAMFVRGEIFELKLHRAATDGMSVRGRLLANDVAKSGVFVVDAPVINVGVAIHSGGTDVTLAPDDDFGEAHLDTLRTIED